MIIGGVMTELTRFVPSAIFLSRAPYSNVCANDVSATWRSAFYLMAALSAVVFFGGILTFDADVVDKEQDR